MQMSHREEKRAKKEEKHVLQVLAALQVKDITHEAAHSKHGVGGYSAWYLGLVLGHVFLKLSCKFSDACLYLRPALPCPMLLLQASCTE